MSCKIFVSAGELSGDIHGGNLIKEIKNLIPEIAISAIGGDNMNTAGAELLYHIRDTSFMGFSEIIKHLPTIVKIWRNTLNLLDTQNPDLVVLIDYPGFNLRLAKAANRRGIPVVYYITPQLWAWHESRVEKIKKYVDKAICILPFEKEWYKERGLDVTFVGHPLLDKVDESKSSAKIRSEKASHLIGLFPGSRIQEVEKHLPIMINAIKILREEFQNLEAAVGVTPGANCESLENRFQYEWLYWLRGRNEDIMKQSDLLIASSGTISLEAVIYRTPLIVIYKMSPISFWIGKRVVKVPYIAMANLIAGRGGIPELIQDMATPENISKEAMLILKNSEERKKMQQFLDDVVKRLGKPGASKRVAKIIIDFLKDQNGK